MRLITGRRIWAASLGLALAKLRNDSNWATGSLGNQCRVGHKAIAVVDARVAQLATALHHDERAGADFVNCCCCLEVQRPNLQQPQAQPCQVHSLIASFALLPRFDLKPLSE